MRSARSGPAVQRGHAERRPARSADLIERGGTGSSETVELPIAGSTIETHDAYFAGMSNCEVQQVANAAPTYRHADRCGRRPDSLRLGRRPGKVLGSKPSAFGLSTTESSQGLGEHRDRAGARLSRAPACQHPRPRTAASRLPIRSRPAATSDTNSTCRTGAPSGTTQPTPPPLRPTAASAVCSWSVILRKQPLTGNACCSSTTPN